jgi:hypothetical protein
LPVCRSEGTVGGEVYIVNDKVVDVAVSVGSGAGEQVIVDISYVIDVRTKLEGMVSG